MNARVDHIIIGKDVARTCTTLGTNSASSDLAEGEVVILDKNKKLLASGSTKNDTDTIYVAVGLSTTYYNPGQTTYTKRVMKVSPAITNPIAYNIKAYTAPVQQKDKLNTAGMTAGNEYHVRVNYLDNLVFTQTPGQFIQQWTKAVTGTTGRARQFSTIINADSNARVTASVSTGGTYLYLTAKTSSTETLTDVDEYNQVYFDSTIYGITSGGVYYHPNTTAKTATTAASFGHGTWQQIRDYEVWTKSHDGVNNYHAWPTKTGQDDRLTVLNETYDQIVIEWDKPFVSADNNYIKHSHETLVIAIPYTATANQMTDILDVLNDWMNSWGFDNISL